MLGKIDVASVHRFTHVAHLSSELLSSKDPRIFLSLML